MNDSEFLASWFGPSELARLSTFGESEMIEPDTIAPELIAGLTAEEITRRQMAALAEYNEHRRFREQCASFLDSLLEDE